MNITNYISLKIFSLSVLLLLCELAHTYLIFRIVKSIFFSSEAQADIKSILLIIGLMIIIGLLNYAQSYTSQQKANQINGLRVMDLANSKSFQSYTTYLNSFMRDAPLELHNRIGLGVVSSLNFIIARLTVVSFLLIALGTHDSQILIFLLKLLGPIALMLVLLRFFQKRIGTKMSFWISSTPRFMSLFKFHLASNAFTLAQYKNQNQQRILNFSHLVSLNQAVSGIIKPLIEVMIVLVLILIPNGSLPENFSNPAILAILYRLQSNSLACLTQYSLLQNSFPATRGFASTSIFKPYVRKVIHFKHESISSNIEIRGPSGCGKSTFLEGLACDMFSDNVEYTYLSAEFLPDTLTVGHILSMRLPKMPNLISVDQDEIIENLSLGQKKAVLLELASQTKIGIVLLDEPFANLDDKSKLVARELIKHIIIPVIITNHEEVLPGFKQVYFE